MSESQLTPLFQFKSYKIDKVNFESGPFINPFSTGIYIPPESWTTYISFRVPYFLTKSNCYVSGLNAKFVLMSNNLSNNQRSLFGNNENVPQEKNLLEIEGGITGVFYVQQGRFQPELEDKMVHTQIPALLMPYLRSVLTNVLSNAGLGSVMLPLVNIYACEQNTFQKNPILTYDQ